jgi:uncharacterized protein (DUF433 family)
MPASSPSGRVRFGPDAGLCVWFRKINELTLNGRGSNFDADSHTRGARFAQRWAGAILAAVDAASLLARIASEPGKMGGKPVIRGRRITPAMVLTMLANGASRDAVLEAYPVLEPEDIDACLLYAARLSEAVAAEGITIAAE